MTQDLQTIELDETRPEVAGKVERETYVGPTIDRFGSFADVTVLTGGPCAP
jgi:hypothetical protein